MRIAARTHWAALRGPTACELLTSAEVAAVRARLGPDPLRRDADPDACFTRISASRAPTAGLLIDQKVLAGVGNVYRAEILFRHGVHPLTPGLKVDRSLWELMW